MRNEIFNQIRQNKIQYYSKLKNSKNEKPKPEIEINEKKDKQNTTVALFLNSVPNVLEQKLSGKSVLYGLNNVYNKMTKSNLMKGLKAHIKKDWQGLIKLRSNVNHKVNQQSERVTQGFYNVSSKFFEDKYEFEDTAGFKPNNLAVKTVYGGTIEWNINNSFNDVVIPVEDRLLKQIENLSAWYKKVCRNTIIWLESDNFFDSGEKIQNQKPETDSSKIIEVKISIKQTAKNVFEIITCPAKFETGFNNIRKAFIPVLRNPIIQSVSLIYNIDFNLNLGTKSYAYLYPVINKFIYKL